MELKDFLESCPIGKTAEIECDAWSRDKFLVEGDGGEFRMMKQIFNPSAWVIPAPRIRVYCSQCGGERNFNPFPSNVFTAITAGTVKPVTVGGLDLGLGPYKADSPSGREFEIGRHVDQFLLFFCGDCAIETKKYSLAVEVTYVLPEDLEAPPASKATKSKAAPRSKAKVRVRLTKYGEIPKPTKPINSKIKRLIRSEWELYRKGADDEAAGNGIGAFAYYRRVVEASRALILDAMCTAATKLSVSKDDIEKIQATKSSKTFTESIKAVDHLFPSELKFDGQNALTALYGPLSEGIHDKSDEDCLAAAADIRTLLDALGERLEQIIEQEDRIRDAMKNLQRF